MTNKKLYPYIITLKNESVRYVNIIGFLLCFGSMLLFSREMIIKNSMVLPYVAGVTFIFGLIIWNFFNYYKRGKNIYYSKALLIAAIVWTRMPYFQWMVVVFALLAILEYQAKLSPEIGFSEKEIIFNGLLKKRYAWNEIENVVLKDGWLTIDFKNNKLFQKEIDTGENEASEKEFNNWCSKYLNQLS